MDDSNKLGALLVTWLSAAILVSIVRWKRRTPGVGLILAYLFNFWLTYWTGPFLYLLPWYQKRFDVRLVEMGVEQSTYAMVAFALGSLALAPSLRDLLPAAVGIHKAAANVPKAYMGIG